MANKIILAKLREPFQGYKVNAEVIFVEDQKMFMMLCDHGDNEEWGWSISNGKEAVLFDEQECLRIDSEEQWWTVFKLLVHGYLKLPKVFKSLNIQS